MTFKWTLFVAIWTVCLVYATAQGSYRYHETKYERRPGNSGHQQLRQTHHQTSSEASVHQRHVDYEQIRRVVKAELDAFRREQQSSGHHTYMSALSRDLQELGRKVDQLMLRQSPQRDVGQQLERRFENWITQLEQRVFNEKRSCEGLERSLAELKTKLDYIQQLVSSRYSQNSGALTGSSGSLQGRLQDPYRYNDLRNSQRRVTIDGPRYNTGYDTRTNPNREGAPVVPRREKTNAVTGDLANIGDRKSDYRFRWEEETSRPTPIPTTPSTPFWRHIRTIATAAPRPVNQHSGQNYAYDHENRPDFRGNQISASQTGGKQVEIQVPRHSNYSFRYPTVIGSREPVRQRQPETTARPWVPPTIRPTLRPTFRPTLRPTMRPTLRPTLRPMLRQTPRPTQRPSHYVRYTQRPPVPPTGAYDPYRYRPRNQITPRPRPLEYWYNAVTSQPRRENPYVFRYTEYYDATARPQTERERHFRYEDTNSATTATPRTAQWYNNWKRHDRQSSWSRSSEAASLGREQADDQTAHHVLSDGKSNFYPSAQYGQCPLYIRGLGDSDFERKSLYSLVGTWLSDAGAQDERVWSVEGGNALNWNSIVEYEDIEAFETLIGQTQHSLPEHCTGLGPVIFKGHLYCQAYDKQNQADVTILKIDLATNEVTARGHLSGQDGRPLGVSGKGWAGIYLQLQLMVDETGMWALAGESDTRRLVLFKVDPTDLTVLSMTRLTRHKDTVGPTFMTCGVLYALDSHYATQLAFTYDTKRQQEKILEKNTPFSFHPLEVISLQYNPVDRKLYTWKVTKKVKNSPFKKNKNSRKRMFGIGERLTPYTSQNSNLF